MNTRRWSITLGLCLFLFAGLTAYKVFEIKAAIAFGESFPEHSESVEIFTTKTQSYTPSIKVLGEVVAPQIIEMRNELPGHIVKVNFQSGQLVDKNQLLIQLDIREENAQLKAALARASLAKSVYKRTLNLRNSNAVSQEALDQAKADLATQQADIQVLKSTIAKKSIRAPFNGTTDLHQLEVGQVLQDNTLITRLKGQQDFVWVDFSVPQFYPPISAGTPLNVRPIGAITSNLPLSDRPSLQATVLTQNTVIDINSRSRQYRARVDTHSMTLTPNAAIELHVPVANAQSLVAVAATAIQHDQLGQYVYELVRDDNQDGAFRAKRQQVKVAAQQDGLALLNTGLETGIQVAGAGAFKLHPGLLVYAHPRTPIENTEPPSTQLSDNSPLQGANL